MPKRDYYEVLGVSSNAFDREIKAAYRALAMEFHPDRNPDNPEAEDKFKEAAEAFGVLSDANKRRMYDLGGHDAMDPSFSGMGVGFGFMDEILSGPMFHSMLAELLSGAFGFSVRCSGTCHSCRASGAVEDFVHRAPMPTLDDVKDAGVAELFNTLNIREGLPPKVREATEERFIKMIHDPEETFRIGSLLNIADREPGKFLPEMSMSLRKAAAERAVKQADPNELCSILRTNSLDFVIEAAEDKLVSLLEDPSNSFISEGLYGIASDSNFSIRVRSAAWLRAVLDTEDLFTLRTAVDSQDLPQKVRASAQRKAEEIQKSAKVASKMGEGLRTPGGNRVPGKLKR